MASMPVASMPVASMPVASTDQMPFDTNSSGKLATRSEYRYQKRSLRCRTHAITIFLGGL